MTRPRALAAGFVLGVLLLALCLTPRAHVASVDHLPATLTDQAFWYLINDFSEAGGSFRSDNLISNESTFQQVIPELRRRSATGGAYVGVGPDQNFTYIAALQPRIAFIVDIRRQNMLLHLMYKAILEQSSDRSEFLSRLFSRRKPAGVGPASTTDELFAAYDDADADAELYRRNLQNVLDRLTIHHRFMLTPADRDGIEYVYSAFFKGGPDLQYSFPRGFGGQVFPTYAELMMETDLDGRRHSYLANEENFKRLKALERDNLIVPIVGDFAGDKALRSVGTYLSRKGATVTVFYTSNVEQYLFQGSDNWKRFFGNVATLPLDDRSTFIRAYFNTAGLHVPASGPRMRSKTLLDPITGLLTAYHEGRVQAYFDVIERSR